jgi:hypothetical protein
MFKMFRPDLLAIFREPYAALFSAVQRVQTANQTPDPAIYYIRRKKQNTFGHKT